MVWFDVTMFIFLTVKMNCLALPRGLSAWGDTRKRDVVDRRSARKVAIRGFVVITEQHLIRSSAALHLTASQLPDVSSSISATCPVPRIKICSQMAEASAVAEQRCVGYGTC